MVVSEMNERLSPNMAPPMTEPMHSGSEKPEASAAATAIGVMSVMVPTLVPIAVETKQLTTNSTATAYFAGMTDSMNHATLSALPRPTTPTKMPASMKMRIMVTMFLSPMPSPMSLSFSSKPSERFCRQATSSAVRKMTTIGIL